MEETQQQTDEEALIEKFAEQFREEEPNIPQTPEQLKAAMANPRASTDILDKLIARLPTGPDALAQQVQLIKRRVVSFIYDGSCGAPGIFMDENGDYLDVKLYCRSLSTVEELEALQGVTTEMQAPFALAKKSLYAIEGKPIPNDNIDFIWEAIGPVGRQLCLMASQSLGNVSSSALGKYRSSFSVH